MSDNGTASQDHPSQMLTVQQALRLSTAVLQRAGLTREGITFGGARDLYATLGYTRDLSYRDYYAKYRRGGIAKRLIDAPVDATWRQDPIIREKAKPEGVEDSPFEAAWQALVERLELWQHIIRADRLASIGEYAVLVLGTRYETTLDAFATELPRALQPEDLVSVQAFSQEHTSILSLVGDTTAPEFGKPGMYSIDLSRNHDATLLNGLVRTRLGADYTQPIPVHATRVIHLAAEGALEDDIYGPPGLEAVWNYLDNLDKVLGGSAEMFWKDAKRRIVAALKDGAVLTDQDASALSEAIADFMHGLMDVLKVQGIDVSQLTAPVADPRSNWEANIEAICATKKIPKRILLGTERGELASDQDEQNWLAGTILTRQMRHAEPLLRRLITRLQRYQYLPRLRAGYEVEWPPARVPTEEQRANIGLTRAKTIATYAGTLTSPQEILPLQYFLMHVMEWDPDQVQTILDEIGRQEAIQGAIEAARPPAEDDADADAEEKALTGQRQ